MIDIEAKLSSELGVEKWQVTAAVQLIDEDNTIPFIARYRKEKTGALNDEVLRKLYERLIYLRNLEDKKLHKFIDNLNPDLRITKSREFFIMSPEDAYELLESIAIISGTKDKLKKVKVAPSKKQKTKRPPVNFAKCGIPMALNLSLLKMIR